MEHLTIVEAPADVQSFWAHKAEQEAAERTQIGNTPSCDECGEQHNPEVECGEIAAHPTYQHNWKNDRCILRGCKATR